MESPPLLTESCSATCSNLPLPKPVGFLHPPWASVTLTLKTFIWFDHLVFNQISSHLGGQEWTGLDTHEEKMEIVRICQEKKRNSAQIQLTEKLWRKTSVEEPQGDVWWTTQKRSADGWAGMLLSFPFIYFSSSQFNNNLIISQSAVPLEMTSSWR